MNYLKGQLDQEIITADKVISIKNCTNLVFENLGATDVAIGNYKLIAGKRVEFYNSQVVLSNLEDLDIVFLGSGSKELYVQTTVAILSCES